MITIFTQNYSLVNISNFSNIACVTQTNDNEEIEYYIAVDQNIILGKYNLEEIPQIISWIGDTIAKHNSEENLCLSMPPSVTKDGDVDAKND